MANHLDRFINEIDTALRTLLPPKKRQAMRTYPANTLPEPALSLSERRHVIGLMRVNHAGEVCAQALYQGQALTARLDCVRQQMAMAAEEEIDHLAWCEQRLYELGGAPSVLNIFWYSGSLLLGAAAGFAGDKISLGFVAETEKQVTAHLQKHQQKLPANDLKSQKILAEMASDEEKHAEEALAAGGIILPKPIRTIMRFVAKIMTKSSYRI